MSKVTVLRMSMAVLSAAPAVAAHAQFVPPAGYSGNGVKPGVAAPTDPDVPTLTRIPDTTLSPLFHVDPDYKRGSSTGHVKVVGAFEIAETQKRHVVSAWSPGFLPVTLSFNDGQCYSLQADYTGGTLSNGRVRKVGCGHRQTDEEAPSSPPPGSPLKFVGSAWGYGAWADERDRTTLVTAPYTKTFQPLFTVEMLTSAIMAMNGPDFPGGNVTLVGRVGGRLTVITLEVGY
ncbi:MAG: hypothetical protein DI606_17900 [Sphingobium sp.]|uniref:hypothetical protein n=1 Tax=Sphingobium sp. TaxID=1912891 RepID=UPI000DB03A40|nr:hypothetical protein [Sphingobium sp.]PZU06549.1 MAG: hypothetical protein DI606_17900 [Sphingobium sp.]